MIPNLPGRYHPKQWADYVGNRAAVESVRQALAYVQDAAGPYFRQPLKLWISGPSGCGKTTLAGLAFQQLGGSALTELNGADCTADYVQSIGRGMSQGSFLAGPNGWQGWIVNEAHAIPKVGVQRWLTVLDTLPPGRFVAFTTTERGNLFGEFSAPLYGRCQQVGLEHDPNAYLKRALEIARLEGVGGIHAVIAAPMIQRECANDPGATGFRGVLQQVASGAFRA